MPYVPASAGSPCSEPCTQLGPRQPPLQSRPCPFNTWRVYRPQMPCLLARAGSTLQRALLQAWSQALAALQPYLLAGLSQSALETLLLDALAAAVRGPDAGTRQAALQYWDRSDVQAALQGYRSVLLRNNMPYREGSYLQGLAGVHVRVFVQTKGQDCTELAIQQRAGGCLFVTLEHVWKANLLRSACSHWTPLNQGQRSHMPSEQS